MTRAAAQITPHQGRMTYIAGCMSESSTAVGFKLYLLLQGSTSMWDYVSRASPHQRKTGTLSRVHGASSITSAFQATRGRGNERWNRWVGGWWDSTCFEAGLYVGFIGGTLYGCFELVQVEGST